MYSLIYHFSCTPQKCEYMYLQNEKSYSKKENAILLYFERPFKYTAIVFHVICTTNNSACRKMVWVGTVKVAPYSFTITSMLRTKVADC